MSASWNKLGEIFDAVGDGEMGTAWDIYKADVQSRFRRGMGEWDRAAGVDSNNSGDGFYSRAVQRSPYVAGAKWYMNEAMPKFFRGVSTATQMVGDVQQVRSGDTFRAGEWKAAWQRSETASVGQVLSNQLGMNGSGAAFTEDQIGSEMWNDYYKGTWSGRIASGGIDLAAQLFLDPTVVLGKARKVYELGELTFRNADEVSSVLTRAGEKFGTGAVDDAAIAADDAVRSTAAEVEDGLTQIPAQTQPASRRENKLVDRLYNDIVAGTDNMGEAQVMAHLGGLGRETTDAGAVAVLFAEANRIGDTAMRHQAKLDLWGTLLNDADAAKRLAQSSPKTFGALKIMGDTPVGNQFADDIADGMPYSEALGKLQDDIGIFADRARAKSVLTAMDTMYNAQRGIRGSINRVARTAGEQAGAAAQSRRLQYLENGRLVTNAPKGIINRTTRYINNGLHAPTEVVHHWFGRRADGTISLDRADYGYDDFGAYIRNLPMGAGERNAKLNEFIALPGREARQEFLARLEDDQVRKLAARHGIDDKRASELMSEVRASRDGFFDAMKRAYTDARRVDGEKVGTVTMRDEAGDIHHFPAAFVEAQMQQHFRHLDMDQLDKAFAQIAKGTVVGLDKAMNGKTALRQIGDAANVANNAWKVFVLLRPGYLVRTQLDQQIRNMMSVAPIVYTMQAMKGAGNLGLNLAKRDQKMPAEIHLSIQEQMIQDGLLDETDFLLAQAQGLESQADEMMARLDEVLRSRGDENARLDFGDRWAQAAASGRARLNKMDEEYEALQARVKKMRKGAPGSTTEARRNGAQAQLQKMSERRARLADTVLKGERRFMENAFPIETFGEEALDRSEAAISARKLAGERERLAAEDVFANSRVRQAQGRVGKDGKNRPNKRVQGLPQSTKSAKLNDGSEANVSAYDSLRHFDRTVNEMTEGVGGTFSEVMLKMNDQLMRHQRVGDGASNWKLVKPNDPAWDNAYMESINRYVKNSPVARELLKPEVRYWDSEVQRKLMKSASLRHEWTQFRDRYDDNIGAWLEDVAHHLDEMIPRQEWRDIVTSREISTEDVAQWWGKPIHISASSEPFRSLTGKGKAFWSQLSKGNRWASATEKRKDSIANQVRQFFDPTPKAELKNMRELDIDPSEDFPLNALDLSEFAKGVADGLRAEIGDVEMAKLTSKEIKDWISHNVGDYAERQVGDGEFAQFAQDAAVASQDRIADFESRVAAQGLDRPTVAGQGYLPIGEATLGQIWKKLSGAAFRAVADQPDRMLGRHPMYVAQFSSEFKKLADRIDWSTLPGGTLRSTELYRLQTLARKKALDNVRDVHFNPRNISRASMSFGMFSPFAAAWEDSMRTYSKLFFKDPSRYARLQLAWTAPERTGTVTEDEQGNKTLVMPLGPLRHITGMTEFAFNKNTFNTIFNGEPWWLPGYGPIVGIALAEIAKQVGFADAIETNPIFKTMLPYGVPKDGIANQLTPPSWKAFIGMADPKNPLYGRYYKLIMAQEVDRFENGERDKAPSQSEVAGKVQRALVLKGVFSFGFGLSGEAKNDMSVYQDIYQGYQRDAKAYYEQGSSPDEAFLTDYPEALEIIGGFSVNETGISATSAAYKATQKYKKEIAENPDFGWAYVGAENVGGDFNSSVYNVQISESLGYGNSATSRRPMSGIEAVGQQEKNAGWHEYQIFQLQIDEAMRQAGITSLRSDAAQPLQDLKTAEVERLKAKYPAWAEDYDVSDQGKVSRFLNFATTDLLTNKSLASRSDLVALNEYIEMRDQLMAVMAANGGGDLDSEKWAPLAQAWDAKVLAWREDIGFNQIYVKTLSGDNLSQARY